MLNVYHRTCSLSLLVSLKTTASVWQADAGIKLLKIVYNRSNNTSLDFLNY